MKSSLRIFSLVWIAAYIAWIAAVAQPPADAACAWRFVSYGRADLYAKLTLAPALLILLIEGIRLRRAPRWLAFPSLVSFAIVAHSRMWDIAHCNPATSYILAAATLALIARHLL